MIEENIKQIILKEVQEKLSPEEAAALQVWLDTSERNRRNYKLLRKIVEDAKWLKGIEKIDKAGGRQAIRWRIMQKRRRQLSIRWMKIAVAVVLPVAIGLTVYWGGRPKLETAVEVAQSFEDILPGSSRAVLYLADGQKVDLNTLTDSVIRDRKAEQQISLRGKMLDYLTARKEKENGPEGEKDFRQTTYNRIVVPRGGEYRLVLADGTKVWLNAGTEMTYPVWFTGELRQVELKGEAYFEVAKMHGKRFQVVMNGATVEVTGTAFNASCYPDEAVCSATLASGSIRLLVGKQIQAVKVGEQAVYNRESGEMSVSAVDLKYYTSWRLGQFYFHNTSLWDITRQLGRWYNVDFVFSDEALKQVCFSGVALRDKPIGYILKLLESTQFVKFVMQEEGKVRVEKG